MRLVIDASISVKWFLPHRAGEQHLEQANQVLSALDRPETELFEPVHWVIETLAVLARLEPGLSDDAQIALDDIAPTVVTEFSTLRRAIGLAVRLNQHLFDTLYHAVALEVGATLVTADQRYFAKAQGQGSIMMLDDFAGST